MLNTFTIIDKLQAVYFFMLHGRLTDSLIVFRVRALAKGQNSLSQSNDFEAFHNYIIYSGAFCSSQLKVEAIIQKRTRAVNIIWIARNTTQWSEKCNWWPFVSRSQIHWRKALEAPYWLFFGRKCACVCIRVRPYHLFKHFTWLSSVASM